MHVLMEGEPGWVPTYVDILNRVVRQKIAGSDCILYKQLPWSRLHQTKCYISRCKNLLRVKWKTFIYESTSLGIHIILLKVGDTGAEKILHQTSSYLVSATSWLSGHSHIAWAFAGINSLHLHWNLMLHSLLVMVTGDMSAIIYFMCNKHCITHPTHMQTSPHKHIPTQKQTLTNTQGEEGKEETQL